MDYGTESWLWGERCAIANMLNEQYFKCVIDDDKEACKKFEELVATIRARKLAT